MRTRRRTARRYVRLDDDGRRARALLVVLDGEPGFVVRVPSSCSGCYESDDGQPPSGATFHPRHSIPLGGGCDECRGRGWRIWQHWVPVYDRGERRRLGFPETSRSLA